MLTSWEFVASRVWKSSAEGGLLVEYVAVGYEV